ncbi:ribose 5-phosphate isomerase A [Lentibacillus halophilus]|uniref:Ribose-5-phosphate isomerase A n=1 Tax=Lentibacillus halophilus TaxID=295065 RepID=A0ABN0ZGV1_9BACI
MEIFSIKGMINLDEKEMAKKQAGEASVRFIENGMTVGLGSGSTVYWMIRKLSDYIRDGMDVAAIPSSRQTEAWAREFGVPLTDFSKTQQLDLTIDGADEADREWNLTKGGGGALVREKIIASIAEQFVVIVDESKLVDQLGSFPLPVEILPFGWQATVERMRALGVEPVIRQTDGEIFVSDNGNYIVDCDAGLINHPDALHNRLKQLVGVVETGIFSGMTNKLIVGYPDSAAAFPFEN